MINRRGSTVYGQKFTDDITNDWGVKAYVDVMRGVDTVLANISSSTKRAWRRREDLTADTWRIGSRRTVGASRRSSVTRAFGTNFRCTERRSCGLKSTTCRARRGQIRRVIESGRR